MHLFTLWDNTPANDNATPARRAAVARAEVAIDGRDAVSVLVLAFRVADNDGLPAVVCKRPVRS
ncbi:MAG: hypothetical protein JNK05_19630 [Myxococcales bacterium]|nr:hypothetical protein [Myxococcales bacterium]